jgi:hypothetical protein
MKKHDLKLVLRAIARAGFPLPLKGGRRQPEIPMRTLDLRTFDLRTLDQRAGPAPAGREGEFEAAV